MYGQTTIHSWLQIGSANEAMVIVKSVSTRDLSTTKNVLGESVHMRRLA